MTYGKATLHYTTTAIVEPHNLREGSKFRPCRRYSLFYFTNERASPRDYSHGNSRVYDPQRVPALKILWGEYRGCHHQESLKPSPLDRMNANLVLSDPPRDSKADSRSK